MEGVVPFSFSHPDMKSHEQANYKILFSGFYLKYFQATHLPVKSRNLEKSVAMSSFYLDRCALGLGARVGTSAPADMSPPWRSGRLTSLCWSFLCTAARWAGVARPLAPCPHGRPRPAPCRLPSLLPSLRYYCATLNGL